MGKRSRKEAEATAIASNGTAKDKTSTLWNEQSVDPTLALLFASSAGPVQAPPKSRYKEPAPRRVQPARAEEEDESEEAAELEDGSDEDLSSVDGDLEDVNIDELSEDEEGSEDEASLEQLLETQKPERKRKRKADDEDLEGKYMQKLAREEEREEAQRQSERKSKRQRVAELGAEVVSEAEDEEDKSSDEGSENDEQASESKPATSGRIAPPGVPLHESLVAETHSSELEKSTRTVFLANVCISAISSKSAKKTLLAHMGSFLPSLPDPPAGKPPHKVESLRFRSTAYSTVSLPKKAAFAKKELMPTTTKSTNAYVVYSTAFAAREASKKLNGTVVLDRHLRVDGVAHPAKTDHTRCVFVGNLGFVDDESMMDPGGENERKRAKLPSDIEEGLWRQFNKAGTVESVRVVRDEKTRVGKGFAYVQFHDANSVEAALLFNEKKYPPMLPRVLRVVRAKAVKKTALAFAASREHSKNQARNTNTSKDRIYNPKLSAEASSLQGRAGKLLGRAGAANYKKKEGSGANTMTLGKRGEGRKENGSAIAGIARTPENIVFEGYRASSKNGRPKDLKMGGGGGKKKAGKPRNRSTKRAGDWKKGGGKKP